MNDKRPGEHLWDQWTGEGYLELDQENSEIVVYTIGHVDIENEIVSRALASALQREGVVDSLKEGFSAVRSSQSRTGWAGYMDGSLEMTVCDITGETFYGDFVDNILEITWVEICL